VLAVTLCSAPAAAQTAATYTDSQAVRGSQVFRRVCSNCHVSSFFSAAAFRSSWSGRAAGELFDLIRSTMPQDNPGQLRRQEYADVLAYIFRLNGVPPGEAELPTDSESLHAITFDPPRPP
jgi:mono/diheme cytochrome c family protein